MASVWLAVALENQRAGLELARDCPRSSVSRSYYAVYAACSGWLELHDVPCGRTYDGTPRDNYAHAQLATLLRTSMMWDDQHWPRERVDDVVDAVVRLLDLRRAADYDPADDVAPFVSAAVRDAERVLAELAPDLQQAGVR